MKEDITCYVCTLIINRKTPIIYGLNKFFIPEKMSLSDYYLKICFLLNTYMKEFLVLFVVNPLLLSDDMTYGVSHHHAQSLTCH